MQPGTAIAVLAGLAFLSQACNKNSPTNPTETNAVFVAATGRISDYLNFGQERPGGTRFEPSTGSLPPAGAGPSANVSGPTTVSARDSIVVFNLASSTAFQKVFVSVPGKSGFLEVPLSAPTVAQGIVLWFNTLPPSLTLQFQLATAGGAVGPAATLSISTASGAASLVAFASPDPIPWSGRTCTIGLPIDPATGCLYETTMVFQETGGATVNITQYQATWTFGGTAAPRVTTLATLPAGQTQIPGGQFVSNVPVRISCQVPTCNPSTVAATAGTLSITITGTDSTGRPVNFKSKDFVLLPAQ